LQGLLVAVGELGGSLAIKYDRQDRHEHAEERVQGVRYEHHLEELVQGPKWDFYCILVKTELNKINIY
jgi:hypothetical protein